MSVNPSSPFSSVNFSQLFGELSPLLNTAIQPTIATPSFLEPEFQNLGLNLTDAAAKSGIAVQTQRTRLTSNTQQDKLQHQPGKLTGKDGKVYNGDPNSVADDERFGILVDNIGKDDSRETILFKSYEAAAKAAGYSQEAAARIAGAVVNEHKQAEESTGGQRATIYNPETGQPRDESRLNEIRRDGQLNFRVSGATLKHFEEVNQRQLTQQQVTAELATGKMPSDELLQKAGIDRAKLDEVLKEIGWQPVPTFEEAVDKLAAEKKAAVLAWQKEALRPGAPIDTSYTNSQYYSMNDAELTAHTRKQAEADIKRAIGKGELQVRSENQPATISARTPTLADRARPMIEKYMPGLAALNTPEGIKTTNVEAFAASYINARLFGATDFYVDKSRFHSERQANEAAAFSTAGGIAGELQNLSIAGKTVEAAMNTQRIAKAMTTLSESGTTGKVLAQALPAATTFGGLETVRETVHAATGQSNGVGQAAANITRATMTGAVFGVFEPLPVAQRVAAVGASSYGVEKVFGAPDREAAISAATNAVFAIAGGSRRAAEELNGKTIRITGENGTAANVQVRVDTGRRVVLTEVAANAKADLQVKVGELKAAARQAIAGKLGNQELGIDAATGRPVAVPKRTVNELLQDPLFRVKSGEEFRQRYGTEVTYNTKVREKLGEIEKVTDKADQLKQLQTLEADVLLSRVDAAKLLEITKLAQTNKKFPYRCGDVNETLSTTQTKAAKEVNNANDRLANGRPGRLGEPDNVQVDANGKIVEVEEVKFFGLDKLEKFADLAKTNPRKFLRDGLGKGSHIQFNKHVETINAVKADPTKIQGTEVKGVADNVKYVLTLPKPEAVKSITADEAFLRTNKAVQEMQKAWKSKLGIDVEVRYSDFSTNDVILMTERLEKGRNQ